MISISVVRVLRNEHTLQLTVHRNDFFHSCPGQVRQVLLGLVRILLVKPEGLFLDIRLLGKKAGFQGITDRPKVLDRLLPSQMK